MIKETYQVRTKKTTLSVTNNKISAVFKSDITKTGLRLYDNGHIGVAGAIGAYDENKLISGAKHMLAFHIPYPGEPAKDTQRTLDLSDRFSLTDGEFVRISEELLSRLTAAFPMFSFSHKIIYEENETRLHNELGADLACREKYVAVELIIKHRSSKNIIDSFGFRIARGYDVEDAFRAVSETCAAFEEKVELPEAKMPVVLLSDHSVWLSKFYSDLNGRTVGSGASLFAGRMGEKLFADHFSLEVSRDTLESYQNFFDTEGTTLPDDRFRLIENGVLKSPYAAKKIAKQYGYALTGSGGGDYDTVPDTAMESIGVVSSGKTIKELLGGRMAVYILIAGGGDFTPQGEFASPVQAAFLFDGTRLCGRLPQLSINSHLYDLFGKDFIGLATDGNAPHGPFKYLAAETNVTKIGDWI